MFQAAVAVALGTGLAASGLPGAWGLGLFLAAVVGAALGGQRLGLLWPWVWILLVTLGFLRALAPLERDSSVAPPATVRDLDETERLGLAPRFARWQDEGSGGDLAWRSGANYWARGAEGGRLEALGELAERPVHGPEAQLARSGEQVLLLPGTPPRLRAEGFVPGPWSTAGILGSLRVAPDCLVRLAPAPRSLLQRGLAGIRTRSGLGLRLTSWRRGLVRAAARIEEAAGTGLPRGLLAALLFGERAGLEHETKDLFTRTGTRHLLAISGLHVGLLAALILLPVTRLLARLLARAWAMLTTCAGRQPEEWTREPLAASLEWPLLILGLLVFVPLAGGSPPVLRAAIVLGLGLGAGRVGRFGRRVDPLNLWGAALLLELLLATRPMGSLSVRLSYLATLGLILGMGSIANGLGAGLQRAIEVVPGAEGWRPAWARAPWTALLIAAERLVSLSLAASLAAVVATLPIAWSTFAEVSPIGVLLTPLCVPLLAWLLTLGWPLALCVATATGLGAEGLADHLVRLTGFALRPSGELMAGLLRWADGLPGTPVALPPRPELLLWIPLLALGAARLLVRSGQGPESMAMRRSRRWLEALALGVTGCLLLPWSPAPRVPEWIALDVGHGTACLLRLETGAIYAFDGGTRDRVGLWREALRPQLARWDGPDPVIILSHADRDHWSGLVDLIERYPPALWAGHLTPELDARLAPGTPRLDLESGSLQLSTGATRLQLVRGGPWAGNEGSRLLLMDVRDGAKLRRGIVTGDAEAEGLAAQLEHPLLVQSAPVEVLLLPHHGSDSPQIDALMHTTQPRRVWISAGGPAQLADELARRGLDPEETALEGPRSWFAAPRQSETAPGTARPRNLPP